MRRPGVLVEAGLPERRGRGHYAIRAAIGLASSRVAPGSDARGVSGAFGSEPSPRLWGIRLPFVVTRRAWRSGVPPVECLELTGGGGERRLDVVVRHPRHTRLTQRLALVLLVTVGGLPVVSLHSADDDPACTGALFNPADEQVVRPSAGAPRSDHCAVCHAMRAFRIASATTRQPGIAVAQHRAPAPERGRLHRVPTDNRLPTRAPPVPRF